MQPTPDHHYLTIRRKAQPERTGKAGQTSGYGLPTTPSAAKNQSRDTSTESIHGSRLSERETILRQTLHRSPVVELTSILGVTPRRLSRQQKLTLVVAEIDAHE